MSQASSQTEPQEQPAHKPSTKEKLQYGGYYITNLFTSLILLTPPAGFGIILWTLVTFAQNGNSNLPDCTSRYVGNGFTGNSDFYGLGIRLGVYLQWWASLLANLFLPNEWYSMFGAYMVFSLALIVAVLVLTFQHACTFTAEIIVVLFMYWGGFCALTYSTKATIDPIIGKKGHEFGTGLSMALIAPMWTSIAFSTWFWLRMATAGEVDFTPTPGGTFYFIFGRISAQNKPALRFIVFICFLFGWVVVGYGLGYMIGFSLGTVWGSTIIFYRLSTGKETLQAAKARADSVELRGEVTNTTITQKWFGLLCAIILIYTTIGIELTLVWNSISGIYSVDSTGQIIPLIAGLCLFINALWKLCKEKKWMPLEEDAREQPADMNELHELETGRALLTAFQHDDGTWQ